VKQFRNKFENGCLVQLAPVHFGHFGLLRKRRERDSS
jgi:hypothetical protein